MSGRREVDDDEFGAPANPQDAATGKTPDHCLSIGRGGNRRVPDLSGSNKARGQGRVQVPGNSLDLRQLGHRAG